MKQQFTHVLYYLKDIFFVREVGLYLLFGLALSVLSLWIFWSVAEDVVEGDPIVVFDNALANELHAEATSTSTSIYIFISWMGSQGVVVIGLLVSIYLMLRRRWLDFTFWLIALVGGSVLNAIMKAIVARPRPVFVDPIVLEQNYSFPSGHSMISLIAYGMLAYLVWVSVTNHYAKIFIVFSATLFIILVGISRMTLGVHYFSDVIGGFAAGGIWLGMCIFTINLYKQRHTQPTEA